MPRYYRDDFEDFPEYISIAERRRKAERETKKLGKTSPVIIDGSRIATTFWGKSWCENLERYSDYANRLPRGRSYVRSGCVVDLRMEKGTVTALVSGSRLYEVEIRTAPIAKPQWKSICHDCAGAIDSLVALLEGRFSKETTERLCQQKTGLFPTPKELKFTCSCPDSARMCKHIAAVLYGIGARLDKNPELLFTLRNVDSQELIANAGRRVSKPNSSRLLEPANLSELFEIDIVQPKPRKKNNR